MNHLYVSAMVLIEGGKVFAAQRNYVGTLAGRWEFPGGKLEPGESAEHAVIREIAEELGIVIRVQRQLLTVAHTYPTFSLTMYVFLCTRLSGEIQCLEHAQYRWLAFDELDSLPWAEADLPVVASVRSLLR